MFEPIGLRALVPDRFELRLYVILTRYLCADSNLRRGFVLKTDASIVH